VRKSSIYKAIKTKIRLREAMQKLPATGKVKNIGICNVQLINLEKLLSHPTCKTIPAINQIEVSESHSISVVRIADQYSYTQIIRRK